MAITVVVRMATGEDARLTFDGLQSIVIGRGASCDVRLPDASVSHRHASLRMQSADLVLVDEGSSNGTFVGGVRVAPRTSRVVRSGDTVRLGRMWIEVRIDRSPVTRDAAVATRNLALSLIAASLDAEGRDQTTTVQVVEGPDQGAVLALAEEERPYSVGRAATCDLPLADGDASREHARIVRRGIAVVLRDLGAKNGTWLGESRVAELAEVTWRTTQMVRIGRTVLALREPVGDALASIEQAPDEAIAPEEPIAAAPAPLPASVPPPAEPTSATPGVMLPRAAHPPRARRGTWSVVDLAVMAAAVGVLALSIAGLVWLLRG
jgi:pSer/pThr/pTyr-binding forkhead associated (FHA) protein